MKRYKARVVEIIHEERQVEVEVPNGTSREGVEDAMVDAAADQACKAKMIGVMDRHVHDLVEIPVEPKGRK